MAIQLKKNIDENKYEIADPSGVTVNGTPIEVLDGTKKKPFPWGGLLIGLSIPLMLACGFYAIAPLFFGFLYIIAIFGVFLYAVFTIVLPVLCTLGLILTNDKYRGFAGTAMDWADPIFKGEGLDIIDFLSSSYIYIFCAGVAIIGAGLVYTIISKVLDKEKNTDKTAQLIAMIIIAVLFAIPAIFACKMFF